mgnify:CR=1 FL=1
MATPRRWIYVIWGGLSPNNGDLRSRDRWCDFDKETKLLAASRIREMLISPKQSVSVNFSGEIVAG